SAFGSKAGDVFTRITVITAIIWITLCMLTIAIYNPPPNNTLNADSNEAGSSISGIEDEDDTVDADGEEVGIDSSEEIPEDLEAQMSEMISDEAAADEPAETDADGEEDGSPELEEQNDEAVPTETSETSEEQTPEASEDDAASTEPNSDDGN
ncbi:MAG: hypothetical protein AAGA30_12590, partial [Planctomycetota bacterium]